MPLSALKLIFPQTASFRPDSFNERAPKRYRVVHFCTQFGACRGRAPESVHTSADFPSSPSSILHKRCSSTDRKPRAKLTSRPNSQQLTAYGTRTHTDTGNTGRRPITNHSATAHHRTRTHRPGDRRTDTDTAGGAWT